MGSLKWGLIDYSGQIILPIKYDFVRATSEAGIISVRTDGVERYIRLDGTPAFDGHFQTAFSFEDGLAIVRRNGLFGIIDESGQLVVDFQFERCKVFTSGLAAVEIGGFCGYINRQAQYIVPLRYKQALPFRNELGLVQDAASKWGYVASNGFPQIACQFKVADDFSEDLAYVRDSSQIGYIDKMGDFVIKAQGWSEGGKFSEGWACVYGLPRGNGKFGYRYINRCGEFVIENTYELTFGFSESRACIRVKDKYGFIDRFGHVVISPIYDNADSFRDGISFVSHKNKRGGIDVNGKIIVPFRYDAIGMARNGLLSVGIES